MDSSLPPSSCSPSPRPGLPLASTSSTFTFLLRKDLGGLDDGVPVKIILDVIGWHAMHLEVSRRYHVLLVHLCMMSWRGNRRQRVHNCGTEAEQTFLHPFLRHLSLWAQWCSLGACGDILEDPSWTYSVWSPCRDSLHEKQPKRIYLSHADQQIKERFTHFFYYSYYVIQ